MQKHSSFSLTSMFTHPTPEQMLRKQLEETERNRVIAAAKVEEWESQLELCCKQIHRIKNDLKETEK